MEFRYIAFSPNAYSQLTYEHNGVILHGTWIEGVYFKHTKTMENPFKRDNEPDLVDNIEHCLICNGMADWNMPVPIETYRIIPETLCLVTPYNVKGTSVVVNDVVRFQYTKGLMQYEGVGKVMYVNNRFILYANEYIDANDVVFLSIIGNVIKNPYETQTFFIQPKNFAGTIIASTWTDIPYRTHTLVIEDQDSKRWAFGRLDLSEQEHCDAWCAHMQRMFDVDVREQSLSNINVNLYFENGKLVALYTQEDGMKILDLRNIFDGFK